MNQMRDIRIEKVTLNIGVGQPGDKLDKAMKLIEIMTSKKPIKTVSMKRIPTWGVRPKLELATKVTLRGKQAEDFLKRLFVAVDNKIDPRKFDDQGNFSFGIPEYIDIPGVEYVVEIGIIGLEAAVTLKRAGFRIKRRSLKKRKITKRHRITKEEAINFIKTKFGVSIGEEE